MTGIAVIAILNNSTIASILVHLTQSEYPEVVGEAIVRIEKECVVREQIGQTVVRYGFCDGSRIERGLRVTREI
jgi:hypothetical protein